MIYQIAAKVTVSAYTEVDADTEEEALRIAANRHLGSISNNEPSEEFWNIDSDGIPFDLEIDE